MLVAAALLWLTTYTPAACAAEATAAESSATPAKKNNTKKPKGTDKKPAGKTTGKKAGKKARKKASKETSRDVKRKEAATQKDIKETEQKIAANDKEVAANLSLLEELNLGIAHSRQRISNLSAQVNRLDGDITVCSAQVAEKERRIAVMRERYINAVKKMRSARKRTSFLGFVFSAKNFYQAFRRVRYLRKYSQWRTRQVSHIKNEIASLNESKRQLAHTRELKETALVSQQEAQTQLADQQYKQRQTVASLRANGEALRSHLARKQAEANSLQARMAELIAAEQAAEEARRRQQQEAERRAAEQRRQQEEAERRAAEQRRQQEEAERLAAQQRHEKETAASGRKETAKSEAKTKKKTSKPAKKEDKRAYAEARGRKPRGSKTTTKAPAASSSSKAAGTSASGFASMKGKLPRPVSGSFAIINSFGRHPLPDLPEVMYDNPGIDAKVGKGESAKAVYDGIVSGVYMINGFSNVVLVSHGDYFTVYGNIASPTVSKGQAVRQGQSLGKLASDPDDDNRTTIHFEVWKGRTKLNPSEWIR